MLQEVQLEVEVSLYLGRLLLVKLRKHKSLVGFDWFCKWIAVQGDSRHPRRGLFPLLPLGAGQRDHLLARGHR